MALIDCPECGKQISDTAKTCIHCGKKLTKKEKMKGRMDNNIAESKSFISKNKKILKIAIPITIAVIVIGIIAYALWYNSSVQSSYRTAEAAKATYEDTVEQREALEKQAAEEAKTSTTRKYQYNNDPLSPEELEAYAKEFNRIYHGYNN